MLITLSRARRASYLFHQVPPTLLCFDQPQADSEVVLRNLSGRGPVVARAASLFPAAAGLFASCTRARHRVSARIKRHVFA